MEDTADIIRAVASLMWPLVGVVVVLRLLPELRKRIRSGDINVKFGQFELSLQQASDSLRKQVKDLQEAMERTGGGDDAAGPAPRPRAATRSRIPTPGSAGTATPQGRRALLWIDADPSNNAYEVTKLQEGGVEVHLAADAAGAASSLGLVDAVVTDADAGLLAEMRGRNGTVPVIVYAAPERSSRIADALVAAGATAVTSSPLELFRELRAVGVTT